MLNSTPGVTCSNGSVTYSGRRYVALTAGSFDFVVLVRVADVETLRDVVLEHLQTMPGVRSTQTMFILEEFDRLDG